MNIKEHIPTLIDCIRLAQSDSTLELEVIFKSSSNFDINRNSFDNIVKRVKGIPRIKLQSNNEILDIYIEDQDNLRYYKWYKRNNHYCKTNNLGP